MKETITRLNIEEPRRCIEFTHISGKGVKYRLRKDYFCRTGHKNGEAIHFGAYISLYSNGLLLIRAGYEWNGANFIPDTDSVLRAALVHDALCELHAKGLFTDHKLFNDLFQELCSEDGMNKFMCKVYRAGLKVGWN